MFLQLMLLATACSLCVRIFSAKSGVTRVQQWPTAGSGTAACSPQNSPRNHHIPLSDWPVYFRYGEYAVETSLAVYFLFLCLQYQSNSDHVLCHIMVTVVGLYSRMLKLTFTLNDSSLLAFFLQLTHLKSMYWWVFVKHETWKCSYCMWIDEMFVPVLCFAEKLVIRGTEVVHTETFQCWSCLLFVISKLYLLFFFVLSSRHKHHFVFKWTCSV